MVSAGHLIAYLGGKPTGFAFVYLVVAAVLFGVAAVLAGWLKDAWRGAIAVALLAVVLAALVK